MSPLNTPSSRPLWTANLAAASRAPRELPQDGGSLDADIADSMPLDEDARADPRADAREDANVDALEAGFSPEEAAEFRSRWDAVQIGFVDDPEKAVQQADELVAQVIASLAESFSSQRSQLEGYVSGDDISTENRRIALRRYRSFFQRLLSL